MSIKDIFVYLLDGANQVGEAIFAIGNNAIIKEKTIKLETNNFSFAKLIHPSAIVSQYANVEIGTAVFSGAVINAFVKVSVGCIINTAAVVEHGCTIDNFLS